MGKGIKKIETMLEKMGTEKLNSLNFIRRCAYVRKFKDGREEYCQHFPITLKDKYCFQHKRIMEEKEKKIREIEREKKKLDNRIEQILSGIQYERKEDRAERERVSREELEEIQRKRSIDLLAWSKANVKIRGKDFSIEKFPFMNEVYKKEYLTPRLVFMKAVQKGVTQFAINRAIYLASHYGMRIIYTLPDFVECAKFSDLRLAPIIEQVMGENIGVSNKYLKQVGDGYIILKGTRNEKSATMIDADMCIYDEVDFSDLEVLGYYISRLEASDYRWEMWISTPTIPDYGIHKKFLESSQKHYFQKCECGKWNKLCCGYPDMWDEEKAIWRCYYCGREVNREDKFEWVAEYPDRVTIGYHITSPCMLDGVRFKESKNNEMLWAGGSQEKYLYNSLLGLPYSEGQKYITDEVIDNCRDHRVMKMVKGDNFYLGVDIGGEVYAIVIRRWEDGKLALVWWGSFGLGDFEREVGMILEQFKIRTAVFDSQPETYICRKLAENFFVGRIWLNHYIDDVKKEIIEWDKKQRLVFSNRTQTMDKMVKMIRDREILFPLNADREFGRVVEHLKNLVRSEEEVRGQKRAIWTHKGADHYAHALNYALIASQYRSDTVFRFVDIVAEHYQLERERNRIGVN